MKNISKNKPGKTITAEQFDHKFDSGADIFNYLDLKNALVVKRVNVDFPAWMVESLDKEARKLNISRHAVVKMWINDRLNAGRAA